MKTLSLKRSWSLIPAFKIQRKRVVNIKLVVKKINGRLTRRPIKVSSHVGMYAGWLPRAIQSQRSIIFYESEKDTTHSARSLLGTPASPQRGVGQMETDRQRSKWS